MRYRDGPLVLKGISLSIQGGHRVGVVGRTGSGKSSLAAALFRIVELDGGSISIDGMDTRKLGLRELRRGLFIIPQDPVLFSASLRFNVDPFDEHSAEEGGARGVGQVLRQGLAGGAPGGRLEPERRPA